MKSRMPEIVEPKQLIQSRVLVKRARLTVKRGAARPNGKSKPPQSPLRRAVKYRIRGAARHSTQDYQRGGRGRGNGTALPPHQVGVWIPKAKIGPEADSFRPLGMPNTLERLVDGSVAAHAVRQTAHTMHPSQAVMSCFKEPQKAVSCIQKILDEDTAAMALLADLSKAFERANPYWLELLRIRRAPIFLFFCCIAERAIKPCRSSRSKLRGEFGIPRHLQNRNQKHKNKTTRQTTTQNKQRQGPASVGM